MNDTYDQTFDGPLFAYRRLQRQGRLKHDPAQVLAAEKLQALHNRLTAYTPPPHKNGRGGGNGNDNGNGNGNGVFGRFFGRGSRKREPTPQGLYLYGEVGRGKSMLMDLLFRTAPLERKRRVHFHAFMQEVHGAIHRWRQARNSPAAARTDAGDPIAPLAAKMAENAWLLCFDEFRVTNVADAMILGRLFSELFARGVVVVATSNVAPDDLYAGGLNRDLFLPFIAVLKDKLDILHLPGDTDHRLARQMALLGGMPVYHHPLGDAAEAALDAAFARLTEGAEAAPETLTVQGRTLTSPMAAVGVARFGFADLCERPLGAADYLAIAARYHTVILSGIPELGPEQRNEARRFIILIDALYEQKVKLVCSAAAPPDRLHGAGDSSFEFARTASRLIEMQGRDYIKVR